MTTTTLGMPTVRKPIYAQPRERFLYLYVTNECGLRCRHCYVGNERLDTADRFSLEMVEQVLDHFKVQGGHDKLYVLGGEPTRHPQLGEILQLGQELGYTITLSSNGDFDDDQFDRMPPAVLSSINFSLEAADPVVHRRIRGNPDNFGRVTGRIARARELGYQVRVMCTVSYANRDSALDLIPYVASLGADTLSFHNLGRTGNGGRFLRPLTPTDWMDFCAAIETHPPQPGLAVYYPPTFVDIEQQDFWSERGYPGCPARTLDRPHVYPDGTVYACPLMMDGQRHYARFIDRALVLNPDPQSELNAYLGVDSICKGCSATGTCGGGCPAYGALPAYTDDDFYSCDRQVTPLCILWTTYAWGQRPTDIIHDYR